MRGFRRAQLRGSDELFRATEPEQSEVPLAPGLGDDHPSVRPVPASPAPDMRSVRLTAEQIAALESLPGWSWSPKSIPTTTTAAAPSPVAAAPATRAESVGFEGPRDALGGPVG